MEKILFNLLSNAYKFTPEGGQVKVMIDWFETSLGTLEESRYLQIKVSDTGIGIPGDNKEKIFERFFQNALPGNIINQGSGIGLAIVKEFVRLHSGTIDVESEPDKGSNFIMHFPLNSITDPGHATAHLIPATPEPIIEEETLPKLKGPRSTILIVEDNEDFRFYLKDNLGLHFRIVEASNGKEGWQKAQELRPDLVVSDIMMPVMNGLELARKIKHDPRTATVPVILLTARTEEEQQLEGLDTGANDYITKPFSFEILLSRIRNLLSEQKSSKKQVKQITVNASEIVIESADEKLVQNALQLVEKNISNADYSVEDLSRELFLSRVGLYRKMVALTGKTPIEFIKDIRMARATQLLQKSKMTVSEVAYEVGFNDPKYFSKAFKKEFGVLPSEYAGNRQGPEEEKGLEES
jgi:DNA-binding response OmpR family regulator